MPDLVEESAGEKDKKLPKKGGKFEKYKWWIIGGLAVIAVLVFFFVNRSNANAQTSGQSATGGTPPGVDPATGIPYAQEYGGFGGFGGGGTGATGATGPRGPRGSQGPRGHRGKRGKRGRRGKGHEHHKTHHRRHRHQQNAAAMGTMLANHNNRIRPPAVRRNVPMTRIR